MPLPLRELTLASTRSRTRVPPLPGSPAHVWLPWLVRLRWGAVVGQLVTIAVAEFGLGLDLPIRSLLAVVSLTAVSNVVLALSRDRLESVPRASIGAILVLDVVLLTALLEFSGGPANPFGVLYLVHVALAALVLGLRWGLAIAALSATGYATLFLMQSPVDLTHALHAPGGMALHLGGMWIATALAAGVIGIFVAQIASALRDRDEQVRRLELQAARAEKLVSLSTLAAGAAHELGTPLATIAVAAGELARALHHLPEGVRFGKDAALILEEVVRCREILSRMSGTAGTAIGEGPEGLALSELLDGVRQSLQPQERARLKVEDQVHTERLHLPRRALVQALVSLVRNALAATPESGSVRLRTNSSDGRVRFEVSDDGDGMTPEVLARAGEPFFTTREPGYGMGLGLFLARAVAEQLGGSLRLESEPGRGTRAWLEVQADAQAMAAP